MCLIYEVKFSMCGVIYKGNTQQTLKKSLDGNFSNLIRPLKSGQKPDSFSDHFEQHFNATKLCTDLRNYMTFKVVKQLTPIGAMKTFTKPKCSICMEEHLTILKS